jgi:nitrite reductase/ring-hydroxylating ferredoxin subunit
MKPDMNRRTFLKTCAKTGITAFAVAATGNLLNLSAHAQEKMDEIIVGESGSIVSVQQLAELQAINFTYQGKRSILLYNDGEIRAFENACTHKKGPNTLRGNKLVCDWHGAEFNPLTGEALKRPAPTNSKLQMISLKIIEGQIFINGDTA